MSSKLFYIVFTLLAIALVVVVLQGANSILMFPLTALVFFGLFLFAYKQFKEVKASLVSYLYLAIGLMFIGFFFFFKAFVIYDHFLGVLFFMLANLAYTRLFYKTSDVRIKPVIPFMLVALVVIATITLLLFDYYGYYYGFGLLYFFVVLNCLQAAYLRYRMVNTESFRLVFYGMLLFFAMQVLSVFDHLDFKVISWVSAITLAGYLISQIMIMRGLRLEKDIRDQYDGVKS